VSREYAIRAINLAGIWRRREMENEEEDWG
jgi:hypothetical protein